VALQTRWTFPVHRRLSFVDVTAMNNCRRDGNCRRDANFCRRDGNEL